MRYAVYCANFGRLGDPRALIDLALEAAAAGWDGFFLYDHVMIDPRRAVRSADPWSVLAVVAERTSLTFGPMVTPLSRRQPWEVAHQALTLDVLSGGRLVLGVGLGEAMDRDALGPRLPARKHGDRLDEALDIVRRLWAGERVTHDGTWRLDGVELAPRPSRGSIPVWVAGRVGARRPLARAAGADGMFPIGARWELDAMLGADELAPIAAELTRRRGGRADFDLATAGMTPATTGAAADHVRGLEQAGATWWLEVIEPRRGPVEDLISRVRAGPPRP